MNKTNSASCYLLVIVALIAFIAIGEAVPIQCPNNEYSTCGSACQTECATLNQTCSIINIRCNDGCYCNEGYARDSSGKCIPIAQC